MCLLLWPHFPCIHLIFWNCAVDPLYPSSPLAISWLHWFYLCRGHPMHIPNFDLHSELQSHVFTWWSFLHRYLTLEGLSQKIIFPSIISLLPMDPSHLCFYFDFHLSIFDSLTLVPSCEPEAVSWIGMWFNYGLGDGREVRGEVKGGPGEHFPSPCAVLSRSVVSDSL